MANTKISGIYKIFCAGNEKPYIGSAISINGQFGRLPRTLEKVKGVTK
jgi:hypothetical protein